MIWSPAASNPAEQIGFNIRVAHQPELSPRPVRDRDDGFFVINGTDFPSLC